MNQILQLRKNHKVRAYFIFGLFTGLVVLMHWLIQGWEGDDYYYSQVLNEISLKEFFLNNYYYHSSRLIIDCYSAIILHISMTLWKILDIIMIACVPLLTIKMLNLTVNMNHAMICTGIFMFYPFYALSECGWAVTTMYYFWVNIFAMIAIYYALKQVKGEKLRWFEILIAICANIIASNKEQISLILLILFVVLFFYQFFNKQTKRLLAIQSIIAFSELIFSFISPGNQVRTQVEIAEALVDFKMLSLLDKFQLGYATTVYYIIDNLFFVLLCLLLCIYIFRVTKSVFYRMLAAFPLLLCLALGYFRNIVIEFIPGVDRITNALGTYGVIDLSNFDIRSAYIPLVLLGMICACVLVCIFIIYPNFKGFLIISAIIGGFLSRMAMGFSPTIYRSGKRTFIPLIMIFLICDCYIFCDMIDKKIVDDKFKYLLISIGCISFISTLTYIR